MQRAQSLRQGKMGVQDQMGGTGDCNFAEFAKGKTGKSTGGWGTTISRMQAVWAMSQRKPKETKTAAA